MAPFLRIYDAARSLPLITLWSTSPASCRTNLPPKNTAKFGIPEDDSMTSCLHGCLCHLRSGHATRAAPASPEVDQDWDSRFCTISSKSATSAARGFASGGRLSLHAPQRAVSERCLAGMRFLVSQCEQALMTGTASSLPERTAFL